MKLGAVIKLKILKLTLNVKTKNKAKASRTVFSHLLKAVQEAFFIYTPVASHSHSSKSHSMMFLCTIPL